MKKFDVKKFALACVFLALALSLNFIESLIPPFAVPGVKPGFSNIAVMAAIVFLPRKYSVSIVLLKSTFVLIVRGAAAFLMSLSGGIFSFIVMYILFMFTKRTSFLFISICGALFHNIAELACASFLMGSLSVFAYFPVMILFGLLTGIINGVLLKIVIPVIKKIYNER